MEAKEVAVTPDPEEKQHKGFLRNFPSPGGNYPPPGTIPVVGMGRRFFLFSQVG